MMKRIYLFPLIFSLCICCSRTNDSIQTQLERECERIGEITLLDGSLKGDLQYDKDKNEVLFTIMADDAIDMMQDVDEQLANDGMRVALSGNDNQLVSLMADAGAGCIAYCSDGRRSVQFAHFTADDVREIHQHPITDAERKEMLLRNYVSKTQSILPREVDDGIVYRHIEIVDEDIVQQYLIDDDVYDLQEIKQLMIEHKYDMVTEPLQRNEYDIYFSHDKGLRMEFYTGSMKPVLCFTIHYTAAELKMLL